MPQRQIDGDNLLYHYLQKDLRRRDLWLFQMLVAKLVVDLGIWLPIDLYRRMPILLPFARRDPSCRGNPSKGLPDEWGAPDATGHFRDDNSLVKGLKTSLDIGQTSISSYRGRRLGKGFVASHVWRLTSADVLASQLPSTYSFVPNLVWLPIQVSKLTDREGSFAQLFIQAVARRIYGHVELAAPLAPFANQAWDLLDRPSSIPEDGLPDASQLTFFDVPDDFVRKRVAQIQAVAGGLRSVAGGEAPTSKVISTRYDEGIRALAPVVAASLEAQLTSYGDAVLMGLTQTA